MVEVTNGIYQLSNIKIGQIYYIEDKRALVDTGVVGEFSRIKKELKSIKVDVSDLDYIIITHDHYDHTSNIKKLHKVSGATLIVHKDEKKLISKYKDFIIKAVSDQDMILDTWEVIHLPGHTDGLMALYDGNLKVLISGDAIFNFKNQPSPPFEKYNKDTELFLSSAKKLINYDVDIICPGHGPAIKDNAMEIIKELFS